MAEDSAIKDRPAHSRFAHLAGPAKGDLRAKAAKAETEDGDGDVKSDEKMDDPDNKTTDEKVVEKLDELEDRIEDLEQEEDEEDEGDEKVASAARVKKAATAARLAERARCEAIFAAPSAAANVPLAAQLAFATGLAPKEAVGIMAAAGSATKPSARQGLGDRMAQAPALRVGSGDASPPGRDTHEGAAAFVLAAAKNARGGK